MRLRHSVVVGTKGRVAYLGTEINPSKPGVLRHHLLFSCSESVAMLRNQWTTMFDSCTEFSFEGVGRERTGQLLMLVLGDGKTIANIRRFLQSLKRKMEKAIAQAESDRKRLIQSRPVS